MNLPTIIILSVIAVIFVAIVINEIRKKKQGKSSCSCGCGGCAFKDSCNKK
ncbi:MAG: FeoB-associated Cys-rich membrane protein [Clostridia bacterium]|nr:FeoB-associated Cys-rich membrane protein [Clostridia bacterium]